MPEIRRIRQTEADAVIELWGGPLKERGRRNIAAMLVLAASSHRAACFVAVEAERVVGFVLAELVEDGLLPCQFGRIEELRGRRGGRARARRRPRSSGCTSTTCSWSAPRSHSASPASRCSNRSVSHARRSGSRTTASDVVRARDRGRCGPRAGPCPSGGRSPRCVAGISRSRARGSSSGAGCVPCASGGRLDRTRDWLDVAHYAARRPCSATIQTVSPSITRPTGVRRGWPLFRPVVSRIAIPGTASPALTADLTSGLNSRVLKKVEARRRSTAGRLPRPGDATMPGCSVDCLVTSWATRSPQGSPARCAPSLPSTVWTLARGEDVLDGTRAAGAMVLPHEKRTAVLLVVAVPVHLALSLGWAVVLAVALPRRAEPAWGVVAGLGIAALDLSVIGRRIPAIRALPQGRR